MLQTVYDLLITWQRTYAEPMPWALLTDLLGARRARKYVRWLVTLGLIKDTWRVM